MALDPEASLRALVEALLRHAGPRDGHDASDLDPTLLAPVDADPLLIQGGGAFATLALALGLLDELARRGATRWSRSRIDTLRRTVLSRLETSHRRHVAAELEAIVTWVADGVYAGPPAEATAAPPGAAGLDAHRALVKEALGDERDLLLEYLNEDAQVWRRLRLRPDGLLDASPDAEAELARTERVSGRRVPEGERVVVALEQVRWMMVVARLGDLPTPRSLATVHAFPARPAPEPDDSGT